MDENENFDFAGFAITTDTVCTDGLSMAENAFAHQDGDTVPLVWGHTSRKTPKSILGTALLKNVKGSDTDKAALIGHSDASMTKYYQSADYESLRAIIDAM